MNVLLLAAQDPLAWYEILLPLLAATIVGGLLGLEREFFGSFAGLRTHMLVSLGASVFTIAAREVVGEDPNALSRVLQGVATGVGFIGAGTILKLSSAGRVHGLTTAASLWLSAALGVAVSLGEWRLALYASLLALIVLMLLKPLERIWDTGNEQTDTPTSEETEDEE